MFIPSDHNSAAQRGGSNPSSDNEKGSITDTSSSRGDLETSNNPAEVEFDTRRGWIPVIAAACSLFAYLGVIYSWGIMQVRLVETANSSLTTLTFVGSLGTSFMISVSIFSGMAVRKFGYQMTALAGAVLMGLGEFLSSWTTEHVGALFVFHGVVFGVGGGLSIFVSLLSHCSPKTTWSNSSGLLDSSSSVVQEVSRLGHGHCVWGRESRSRHNEHCYKHAC